MGMDHNGTSPRNPGGILPNSYQNALKNNKIGAFGTDFVGGNGILITIGKNPSGIPWRNCNLTQPY